MFCTNGYVRYIIAQLQDVKASFQNQKKKKKYKKGTNLCWKSLPLSRSINISLPNARHPLNVDKDTTALSTIQSHKRITTESLNLKITRYRYYQYLLRKSQWPTIIVPFSFAAQSGIAMFSSSASYYHAYYARIKARRQASYGHKSLEYRCFFIKANRKLPPFLFSMHNNHEKLRINNSYYLGQYL